MAPVAPFAFRVSLPSRNKESPMKRTLSLMMVTLFTLSLLAGCNTVRGVGQDIEQGGEAIQESSS